MRSKKQTLSPREGFQYFGRRKLKRVRAWNFSAHFWSAVRSFCVGRSQFNAILHQTRKECKSPFAFVIMDDFTELYVAQIDARSSK